ncbi:DUF433 domain-containing protein [Patescibacteria group bacterium]|nr:DUF433 domain-containing protein [Patescibacteria group bacterium]MBU1472705.1 DUF433 domain-containing protein [Patescibacteria group bacterium]MBU2459972.1 DUF433 domain-containing protein [Patescibacteria group bacterium]MBU2544370.1 DUF433 domain-containing protein [Patescibacteria group bacterium]
MKTKSGFPKILVNSEICHGKPVFQGTRVMVWQILELLEAGMSAKEIYSGYPTLPAGAIEAALHFAAEQIKGFSYVPFSKETSQTQVFA